MSISRYFVGKRIDDLGEKRTSAIPGLTQEYPIHTLSDLASFTSLSGIQDMWTTFEGNLTSPIQIKVNFDLSDGPWYCISFYFPSSSGGSGGAGWNRINNTAAFSSSSDTNHFLSGSGRWNRTVDIQTGMGSVVQTRIWDGNTYSTNYSASNEGWYRYDVGGDDSPTLPIYYYNHSTGQNFTTTETNSIRSIISELSTLTPHLGMECDSQGLTSNSDWKGSPITNLGHAVWIQDSNGNWLRATPTDAAGDESGSCYLWTKNSYSPYLWSGGSSFQFTPQGGTVTGLYTNELIMPNGIQFRGDTGGSAAFGSAYSNQSGFINRINNRTYFMVK